MRYRFSPLLCLIAFIPAAGAHPDHVDPSAARQGCPVSATRPPELSCGEIVPGAHEASDDSVRLVLRGVGEHPGEAPVSPLPPEDLAQHLRIRVRHLSVGQDGSGAPGSEESDTNSNASEEEEKQDEDHDALHEWEENHTGSLTGSLPLS